jgi:hypothetical protein
MLFKGQMLYKMFNTDVCNICSQEAEKLYILRSSCHHKLSLLEAEKLMLSEALSFQSQVLNMQVLNAKILIVSQLVS